VILFLALKDSFTARFQQPYMGLRSIFWSFYRWGLTSPEDFLKHQKTARNLEWKAIREKIPEGSDFLDIGCGKGHSMSLALIDRKCRCTGVDPYPDAAGALPELIEEGSAFRIIEGWAEKLPFPDNSFDVVYSSHMLEHTSDYHLSLAEMNRVVRPGGVVIIGVPTASMVVVRIVTTAIFCTHRYFIELLFWPFRDSAFKQSHPLKAMILPMSHGKADYTVLYDLFDYRVNSWAERVRNRLDLNEVILPGLYPFPDYSQWFKPLRGGTWSSSAFFIARKKRG